MHFKDLNEFYRFIVTIYIKIKNKSNKVLKELLETSFDNEKEEDAFKKIVDALDASSNLSKHEFSNVMERVFAYGLAHNKIR